MREPLPSVAAAIRFIDCVNRNDLDGLVVSMTVDHRLEVFDEEPLVGREANAAAWRGYSHLALPDDEEARQTLIWLAETNSGRVQARRT